VKKVLLPKISLLGLILTAASVVTAAILPGNKKNTDKPVAIGSLTASDDNYAVSCTTTDIIDNPCQNTNSRGIRAISGTTEGRGSISNQSTLADI